MSLQSSITEWTDAFPEGDEPFGTLAADLAYALGKRNYDELPALVSRAARAALVYPERATLELGPLFISIDAITSSLQTRSPHNEPPAEALLAIADLTNLLWCLGVRMQDTSSAIARSWLPSLTYLGPTAPAATKLRVGFAALALNDLVTARTIAGIDATGGPFAPGEMFKLDVRGVLVHLLGAFALHAEFLDVQPAWTYLLEQCSELGALGQLDEPTLWWIARLVHHDLAKKPISNVAKYLHDLLWQLAADERAAAATTAPPAAHAELLRDTAFPLQDTLDGGAYRADQHALGRGAQRLYFGRRAHHPDERYLISLDWYADQDIGTVCRALSYRIPGVLDLAFVGRFDELGVDPVRDAERRGHWAMIEKLPAATWLPRLTTTPIDPAVAVSLGRSAGQILATAASSGVLLTGVRPEYIWASEVGSRLEIAGVSGRGPTFFAWSRARSLPTLPLFEQPYAAPEVQRNDTADDRALVFTLSLMIARWAMGTYPVATGHLSTNGLPAQLGQLLSRATQPAPAKRPSLSAFLSELAMTDTTASPRRL